MPTRVRKLWAPAGVQRAGEDGQRAHGGDLVEGEQPGDGEGAAGAGDAQGGEAQLLHLSSAVGPHHCWLALLLIRVAENRTQDTWRNLRHELQRLHLGAFQGSAGRCLQRTEITSRQAEILKSLEIPEPSRFLTLEANTRPAA